MCMHMHTYGCMDIHLPRHLVHAYAYICIHMSACAYMCEHMYTNACVRARVCICTYISARGGGEQPKNLTPPLGGALGPGPDAYIYIYVSVHVQLCASKPPTMSKLGPRPQSQTKKYMPWMLYKSNMYKCIPIYMYLHIYISM